MYRSTKLVTVRGIRSQTGIMFFITRVGEVPGPEARSFIPVWTCECESGILEGN